MEIIKRDGRIEPYQSEKIKAAVAAAFQSIKTEIDEAVLNSITEDVQQQLVQMQQQHESLQVETIQDVVEKTLVARNFYNEVKSIIVDGKKPGNIRFNLLNQDTPVNINFIIQNNIDSEFNLCISRSKGTKFTSDEKITKESKGSVIITKQEFTPDEMGDIYDLNVTVKRDGEVLFEGNGYKNINFK